MYVYLANFIKFSRKISKMCCITQLVFGCRGGSCTSECVLLREGHPRVFPNLSLGKQLSFYFLASFPFQRKQIFPWESGSLVFKLSRSLGCKLCYYYYYYDDEKRERERERGKIKSTPCYVQNENILPYTGCTYSGFY